MRGLAARKGLPAKRMASGCAGWEEIVSLEEDYKPALLSVRSMSKSFGSVKALIDTDLDLYPGEVLALMGENGAGKSTLVKILAGLHMPSSGEIRIAGQKTELPNPRASTAAGISTVHQELLLFGELTVAENIFSGHYPRTSWGSIDWNRMRNKARELLADLDCYDLDVDAKVATLSVAMRQRVEIARALNQDAQALILDEPTAALAESDAERLLAIVDRLRKRGVGIIYVSHRMKEIFKIADRMAVLRDGKLIGVVDRDDATPGMLVKMMVGREIDQAFPKLEAEIGGPVLEVEGLNRGHMVKDATFNVRSGEIVGFAGLVGSGRTELAHVLFGATPADSGTIKVDGSQVQINSPKDARNCGIAYVPEDRGQQGLVRPMTIRENLTMSVLDRLSPAGFVNRREERKIAKSGFERLGVRASGIEQIVGTLSGGNQQKVVIAKWLETEPKVLILDEPTRGIDVGAKAEIHRLIGEMAQAGLAIIVISSELPEVLAVSDRVLVIADGHITAEFDRKDAHPEAVGHAMTITKESGRSAA